MKPIPPNYCRYRYFRYLTGFNVPFSLRYDYSTGRISYNIGNTSCAVSEQYLSLTAAITPEAITFLDFVILSEGNNLHGMAHEIFRAYGIEPRIKLEISQFAMSYYLVRSGFRATFIRDRMIIPEEEQLNFYQTDSSINGQDILCSSPQKGLRIESNPGIYRDFWPSL